MKRYAPVFVLAAGTLWGVMGVFVRKLESFGFSPLQIACLRILFGAVLFLLVTALYRPGLLKIRLRDAGLFLGMGLVSLLLFTVCYFTTIDMASLSVAAILLYTSPIWVMLLSALCFREKITRRKLLSAAGLSPVVIVTGLLSAVGYGLYSIFGTFALRKYHPLTVTTYAFLFGAVGALVLCNPVQIVGVISYAGNPQLLVLLIAATALFTAVLPYLLYTVGLNHMKASAAAIMASVEPVVATAAGALVFGETLTVPAFAGIALVLGAILVLNAKG